MVPPIDRPFAECEREQTLYRQSSRFHEVDERDTAVGLGDFDPAITDDDVLVPDESLLTGDRERRGNPALSRRPIIRPTTVAPVFPISL
ncbi:hypothetical protein ACFFQF_11260 [Haladaptatus pallidirubidus]|nr:hypothetical protein [Haladaptatus pallidirubidus]